MTLQCAPAYRIRNFYFILGVAVTVGFSSVWNAASLGLCCLHCLSSPTTSKRSWNISRAPLEPSQFYAITVLFLHGGKWHLSRLASHYYNVSSAAARPWSIPLPAGPTWSSCSFKVLVVQTPRAVSSSTTTPSCELEKAVSSE